MNATRLHAAYTTQATVALITVSTAHNTRHIIQQDDAHIA